jgi:hypothetical protein
MTNNTNLVSGGAVPRIDRAAAITRDRRHFIGGSDARIIMGKDEKAPSTPLAREAWRGGPS